MAEGKTVETPKRKVPARGPFGGGRPVEHAKDFKGTVLRLFGYLGEHRVALVIGLAFAIVSVVFNIVGPKILGQVTTKLYEGLVAKVQGTGDIDFGWIGRTLMLLAGLYLASSGASFIQGWLMSSVSQKVVYRLRGEIARKISVVPLSYFGEHSKGDVLSRITNDVDTLGTSLNQSISQLVTSITQVIGVLVMMLSISLPLTGVTLLTLPVSVAIVMCVVHFSQKWFRAQQVELGAVNGMVEENFAGQEVIQVFDRGEASIAEFDEGNDRLFKSAWLSQFISGLMMPFMTFVGNMGYVGVVAVGAALAVNGQATPGDIQSFIQYVRNFTQPIQQLSNVSNMLQSMTAAAERVFEFLGAPEEEEPAEGAAKLPERRAGRVSFDHVRFGYVPGKTVIHDFSCAVEPGETVAIVGPTGAGKTTLMKLLQRFYDVDGGAVRVEGIDVRDWQRNELRADFATVLQDTWLFHGTIRENIRYGRADASDAEVEAAARAAQCDHFIRTLAGGYDFVINEEGTNVSQGQRQLITIARAILADRPILILDEATSNVDTRTEEVVQRAMDALMQGRTSFVIAHRLSTLAGGYDFVINEEGTNVSQGQRQLITIARAILADRPILILDEATSNVDTRTEEVVQRAMDALMQGRTSFVIAHRLSTIRNADRILVLRDGDVVESGTHEELLAAGGFYAELYNSQFEDCD